MIIDSTIGPQTLQAPISFSGSGDNIVIPGVVGKLTKVLQMFMVLGGDSNLTFKSGANAISGVLPMLANGSIFMDYIQLPLTLNVGESFVINSSVGVAIGGTVWYTQS